MLKGSHPWFLTLLEITDENLLFLKNNKAELIDKVKNIAGIVDYLELSSENAAIVQAQETDQARMRKLLEFTTSKRAAKLLVEVLERQAGDVLEDLNDSSDAEEDAGDEDGDDKSNADWGDAEEDDAGDEDGDDKGNADWGDVEEDDAGDNAEDDANNDP